MAGDRDLFPFVDAVEYAGEGCTCLAAAVRLGLNTVVNQHQRQRTGQQIAEAYRRHPQNEQELAGLDESTRSLVEEEPW